MRLIKLFKTKKLILLNILALDFFFQTLAMCVFPDPVVPKISAVFPKHEQTETNPEEDQAGDVGGFRKEGGQFERHGINR